MIRKARTQDVQHIYRLVEEFSKKGGMLYRPTTEIYDQLRDFFVYDRGGEIEGIAALHVWGADLAEIRSLAVLEERRGAGAGRLLIEACIEEARTLGVKKIFALTYRAGFFEKLGFQVLDKLMLPQKIWGDCAKCTKFPSCDETAVIREVG